jgi:branched-chain amino acid transport system permease protein
VSEFLVHALTIVAIQGLVALALNFQAGSAGLMNFGHVAFVGVGAYAVGIAHQMQWHPALGWALGIAMAGGLGLGMALLGRNLGADYWGIATLAVAEIVRTVALNEDWLTGGAQGISGIAPLWGALDPGTRRWAFLLTAAIALAVVAGLCARAAAGRFGRALRLMREEPALATSLGYSLLSLKCRATAASAMVAGLAGCFLGHYVSFVGPDFMQASETFMAWTMVMLGGVGNVAGVVLGVVLVQAVHMGVPFVKDIAGVGSDAAGALRLGLVGCLLLACLLWRRDGLLPETPRRLP